MFSLHAVDHCTQSSTILPKISRSTPIWIVMGDDVQWKSTIDTSNVVGCDSGGSTTTTRRDNKLSLSVTITTITGIAAPSTDDFSKRRGQMVFGNRSVSRWQHLLDNLIPSPTLLKYCSGGVFAGPLCGGTWLVLHPFPYGIFA